MQTNITGLGAAYYNPAEYTSQALLTAFNNSITTLQQAFQTPSNAPASEYDAAYQNIITQIQTLKNYAQNGVPTSNGTETYPTYLSIDMVSSLNNIMGTLSIAGIPITNSDGSIADPSTLTDTQMQAAIQAWQSVPQTGINVSNYFTQALAIAKNANSYFVTTTNPNTGQTENLLVTAFPTRSLQSALELDYIAFGNQLISTNLNNLENGLTVTQQVINTLTSAQDVMNEITVGPTQPGFKYPPGNDAQIPSSTVGQIFDYLAANDNGETAAIFLNTYNGDRNAATAYVAAHPGVSMTSALAMQTSAANFLGGQINNSPDSFQGIYQIIGSAYFAQIFPSTAISNLTGAAANLLSIKSALLNEVNELTAQNSAAGANVAGTLANNCFHIAQDISGVFANVPPITTPNPIPSATVIAAAIQTGSPNAFVNEIFTLLNTSPAGNPNAAFVQNYFSNHNLSTALAPPLTNSEISLTDTVNLINLVPSLQTVAVSDYSNVVHQNQLLSSVKTYILDGQNKLASTLATSASQNPFQTNITNAITNASTIEENQKESVKQYIFIFQQYYQATASMLATLEQILQKIAQGIDSP